MNKLLLVMMIVGAMQSWTQVSAASPALVEQQSAASPEGVPAAQALDISQAPARLDVVPPLPCSVLARTDFANIQDAPTQVAEATSVPAAEDLPAYCRVQGYVAPNVGILLSLPSQWNGKFMEGGCGAHCGSVSNQWTCHNAVSRGYACIVTDMGHMGAVTDGLWGNNNLQAKLDWGVRATHVVALAGKAITERFYRQKVNRSYFIGCSTGGRQALQEGQRFPWDFDGIIAGAFPISLANFYLAAAWENRLTHDSLGRDLIGSEDLKLVAGAAVAHCDRDDGLKDNIIGDPLRCSFKPSTLRCKPGQAQRCLTADQVAIIEKLYAGYSSSRTGALPSAGIVPGSEYEMAVYLGVGGYSFLTDFVEQGLRYLFLSSEQAPTWKLSDFDFDRDPKRLGVMESIYDSGNPDLREFKAAGGKMIGYVGMNDPVARPAFDYYEMVERTMGGRAATQDFFRLFAIPGMNHCSGGPGADTVDYLSYLEAWVERGETPDRVVGAHVEGVGPAGSRVASFPLDPAHVKFTRPVYPYPIQARYKGTGNPNDANSFGPVTPKSTR